MGIGDQSCGSFRLNVTVYPSGWTVAWLTEVRPSAAGPRTRHSRRWSIDGDLWLLDDPVALVERVMGKMPSA